MSAIQFLIDQISQYFNLKGNLKITHISMYNLYEKPFKLRFPNVFDFQKELQGIK